MRLHEGGTPAKGSTSCCAPVPAPLMGPLALIDLLGVDVTVAVLESLAAVEDDPRLRLAAPLTDLLAAGRLGRRPGAGFHTY